MTQQSISNAALTYDVMAAMRAGMMLQKPRIHTFLVKSMSAGNDTQFLQEQMKEYEKVLLPNECIFHSIFLVFLTWLLSRLIPGLEVLRRKKMPAVPTQPKSTTASDQLSLRVCRHIRTSLRYTTFL